MKKEEFYHSVYEVVNQIPRGKVTIYGAIARIMGVLLQKEGVCIRENGCVDLKVHLWEGIYTR